MHAVRLAPVRNLAVILLAGASLAACATHPRLSNRMPSDHMASTTPGQLPSGQGGIYKVGKPYQVGGIWYVPREDANYDATGMASWYGAEFNMKPTANGETFDMRAVSAAHTTLPLPSMVEVTNLENGKRLQVRVNDRGPFVDGRLIDLSHEAARQLGYDAKGLAKVRVRYLGPAPLGVGEGVRYAQGAAPMPMTAPQPVVARAGAVSSQALPPLAAARPATYGQPAYVTPSYAPPTSTPPSYGSTPAPVVVASTAPSSGPFRVQAGAYGDEGNAQRAVRELSMAGPASIEPVDRDGERLYRVMLAGGADEVEAWATRDRVAALGFEDARVIRPF
ncbi:septal ring lytic transglycosylase RlpA family protein [Phenylobacterium sp.]|uniref:septal ring lytic transglycosylase RlpA family protein n=1 Tax=Phenylobacterium sp. TaxID=1871053 RepID=UPI002736EF08|nr:septal ring lytic transglycosylase RlpA family protein [Phenylobacterium sp.]MDP3659698.1 septal ring lytic transglycosylase RlpA family protein [Phenylobacterium sp.]